MRAHREIIAALIAILLITGLYLGVVSRPGLPASSGLIGHGMGVLGFVLLLATETLYSIRKRGSRVHWGRMQTWLQFHIFTGMVGPFLILLHSTFEFRGLAGIVALIMGLVVLSGFVGRHIYTAVPRTSDGCVVAFEELELALAAAEEQLQSQFPEDAPAILQDLKIPRGGIDLIFGRAYLRWRSNTAWRRRLRAADEETRRHMLRADSVVKRRNDLVMQVRSFVVAQRVLSIWHSVHIPLGMALFAAAVVHIGAALYYATLMR